MKTKLDLIRDAIRHECRGETVDMIERLVSEVFAGYAKIINDPAHRYSSDLAAEIRSEVEKARSRIVQQDIAEAVAEWTDNQIADKAIHSILEGEGK